MVLVVCGRLRWFVFLSFSHTANEGMIIDDHDDEAFEGWDQIGTVGGSGMYGHATTLKTSKLSTLLVLLQY